MDLLNQNKISTLIQFGYKAKKVVFGESVIMRMLTSRVKIMILATDVAPSQEKKYLDKAKYYNVPVIRYLSKADLGSLFLKEAVACIGIEDINMAKQIKKLSE